MGLAGFPRPARRWDQGRHAGRDDLPVGQRRERLAGLVEVDETSVGGIEAGVDGRQTATKSIVAIAVEVKHPKGLGRIGRQRVDDVSKDSLIAFIESAVKPGATVHTDGWPAYWTVPDHGDEPDRTVMRGQHDPADVLMPGVHRVASLLKRWMLEQAVITDPITYRSLIVNPRPGRRCRSEPRRHPPPSDPGRTPT